MIPQSMKENWWLVPGCITGVTLGMFIMIVYLFPAYAPEMHERMVRKGLGVLAPLIGGVNILAPVATLWYHCRAEQGACRREEGNK